jgi:hypothetical protein
MYAIFREMEEDIGDINRAQDRNWWIKLVEGDAQVLVDHYRTLSYRMNSFVVSIFSYIHEDGFNSSSFRWRL